MQAAIQILLDEGTDLGYLQLSECITATFSVPLKASSSPRWGFRRFRDRKECSRRWRRHQEKPTPHPSPSCPRIWPSGKHPCLPGRILPPHPRVRLCGEFSPSQQPSNFRWPTYGGIPGVSRAYRIFAGHAPAGEISPGAPASWRRS